jgi:hypothetical protein
VVGPNIGDWDANISTVQSGPYGYFGTYTGLIPAAPKGSLSVLVLKGPTRVVQLLGAKSTVGCPSKPTIEQLSAIADFPEMYELGRKTTDIFTDITVDIDVTYDPNTAIDFRTNNPSFPKFPNSFSAIVAVPGDGQVTLSWINTDTSATYTVSRGTSTGVHTFVVSTSATTPFVDTGLINGTTYYYIVTAINIRGGTLSSEVSVTPFGTPVFSYSGATGTTGSVGIPMTVAPTTVNSNGAAITNCVISAPPALPAGLVINPTTCVISGTPTVAAPAATYTVVATNPGGNSSATVSLTVTASAPTFSYSGATGTTGSVGIPMTVAPTTVNTNGAPITGCVIVSPPLLPAGLTINPTTCVISGTPTVAAPAATYTVVATNSGGSSAPVTLSLTVTASAPAFSYSGATGTTGSVGIPMTVAPTTVNTNGAPITGCVIVSPPSLPAGLTINPTTCVISGTPTVAAVAATYTVVATNSGGSSAPVTLSLTVNASIPTLSYAGALGTSGHISTPMSITPTTLNANGASITACAIQGPPALPVGLSLNATTCVISGTPTVGVSGITYTVVATNSAGNSLSAIVSLTINVGVPDLNYVGAIGTAGFVNVPMVISPTTFFNNGAAIINCFVSGTPLPAGLSVNSTTCVISGVPAAAVPAANYTIVAVNSVGNSLNAVVSLTTNICDATLFAGGSGTSLDPYLIGTSLQLANIASCTPSIAHFKQTADINLGGSAVPWIPVTLAGSYHGNNHQITGLYIRSVTVGSNIGLFGNASSASLIENLTVAGADIQGAGMTGALVGLTNGSVNNCSSSGNVSLNYPSVITSSYYAGGLVGQLIDGVITTSHSSASLDIASAGINAIPGAAGLVGSVAGAGSASISNSYATGNISLGSGFTSSNPDMGGLVGSLATGSVTQSYATGNITAGNPGGTLSMGLIAYSAAGTVSKCFSTSSYSVTGVANNIYMGSLIGDMQGGTLSDSYGMVSMSVPVGSPVISGAIGGLIGHATVSPVISASYSAASSIPLIVNAGTTKGFSGTPLLSGISNGYYYFNASVPSDTSSGVTGLTTVLAMENQGSYVGFDFVTNWAMPSVNPLSPTLLRSPVLRWQCATNGIICL